jgi:hypothetical protein
MPLTRGEAVGYDADLMLFKFTMRNGEQIVQCEISNAALGDLAGRWRCGERDVAAEFQAHRKFIEARIPVWSAFLRNTFRQRSADVKTPIKPPIRKTHSVRLDHRQDAERFQIDLKER